MISSSIGLFVLAVLPTAFAFQTPSALGANHSLHHRPLTAMASTTAAGVGGATTSDASATDDDNTDNNKKKNKSHLYVPAERDERYGGNVARYLLDLDEEGATFDFCGGMMFQLVLSDMLKSHLGEIASSRWSEEEGDDDDDDQQQQQQQQHQHRQQPVIHPTSQSLMNRIPNYKKSAFADNISAFHGRELRGIPKANGGMGFVLQLGYADPSGSNAGLDEGDDDDGDDGGGGGGPVVVVAGKGADAAWTGKSVDPQGWSYEEISTYDGWRGDSFRKWRGAKLYEEEGYATFDEEYGKDAYGLNHRCFLHYDERGRMWLSAEDGCEGTPTEGRGGLMGRLGGMLFGK